MATMCVHIGAAMLQLFPGAGEESPPQPEYDGSGQRPHDGIGMGHIHEEHAYDDNGHRQDDGPGCAEFQCAEFLVVGLFRLFERVAVLVYQQVISGRLHSLLQSLGRTARRVIFTVAVAEA